MTFQKWYKKTVCIPSTSLFTLVFVGYIAFIYLTIYVPTLREQGYDISATVLMAVFICFPTLIFWVLIRLVLGDPGRVTKEMASKIYKDNNIDESKIGTELTMPQVLEILTENYLKS